MKAFAINFTILIIFFFLTTPSLILNLLNQRNYIFNASKTMHVSLLPPAASANEGWRHLGHVEATQLWGIIVEGGVYNLTSYAFAYPSLLEFIKDIMH